VRDKQINVTCSRREASESSTASSSKGDYLDGVSAQYQIAFDLMIKNAITCLSTSTWSI